MLILFIGTLVVPMGRVRSRLSSITGISKHSPSDPSPSEVVAVWDRARNTFLYGWYSYDLVTAAQPHAYMALELALRERLGDRAAGAPGLQSLIERAVKDKLVVDRFRTAPSLASMIATLRNGWGHGSADIHDPNMTIQVIRMCRELIAQLYP